MESLVIDCGIHLQNNYQICDVIFFLNQIIEDFDKAEKP